MAVLLKQIISSLIYFSTISKLTIPTVVESFQIIQIQQQQKQKHNFQTRYYKDIIISNNNNNNKPRHNCLKSNDNNFCQQLTKLSSSIDNSNNILEGKEEDNSIDNDNNKYDYLLAIPLEENHDLLLELESVQRGILYHCPKLADSCIMPVSTRMPLLLISDNNSNSMNNNANKVIETFEGIIKEVIEKEIYEYSNNINRITKDDLLEEEGITEERRKGGINDEGIRPLMMTFQGLELEDGITQPNEILYAIGKDDYEESEDNNDGNDDDVGSTQDVIRNIINKIRVKLENLGYGTRLPDDQPHVVNDNANEQLQKGNWRARVPFMRLPNDFISNLENEDDDDDEETEEEEQQQQISITDVDSSWNGNIKTPEEGYNGISPLFWYKWDNDKFTDTVGIRLRTISIYQRQSSANDIFSSSFLQQFLQKEVDAEQKEEEPLWSEKMFYIPVLNIPLPIGNSLLTQHEAMLSSNAMSRLDDVSSQYLDETQQQDNPQSITGTSASTFSSSSTTISSSTTSASTLTTNINNVQDKQNNATTTSTAALTTNNDEIIPKIKSLERYRKKIRLLEQQQQDSKTLFQSTSTSINTPKTATTTTKEYPSIEHFAGIWRLVLSNNNDNNNDDTLNNEEDNNPENDNIILRIDGTIAGGPVLSTITTMSSNSKDNYDDDDSNNDSINTYAQKAASGSKWKFYQAKFIGGNNDNNNDDDDIISTRMRIQLVIPPHKTDELVLEGEVIKLIMPGKNTNYLQEYVLDNNNAFQSKKDDEYYLQIQGEVWMQSTNDNDNEKRKKMGRFSAVKLATPNKKQLRYSIPAPKR